MTDADEAASNTDQDTREEERRRRGPALSDAQLDELQALGHQLLNSWA